MNQKRLTIITPTTGKPSLNRLLISLKKQNLSHELYHILLWDDYRTDGAVDPKNFNDQNTFSLYIPGHLGENWGSHLRAVGLVSAQTDYVTFADDDVWWNRGAYEVIRKEIIDKGFDWGGWRRLIWNPDTHLCIGEDNFESVGQSPSRKVPYEFLDNSCMIFKRKFGVYASPIYREIETYSDDRQMYSFLKHHSTNFVQIEDHLVNQFCPQRLIPMFEKFCD